jgi:hypothetical protein
VPHRDGRRRSRARSGRLLDVKKKTVGPLTLAKPTAISGKPAWFADAYAPGHAALADRRLFSS